MDDSLKEKKIPSVVPPSPSISSLSSGTTDSEESEKWMLIDNQDTNTAQMENTTPKITIDKTSCTDAIDSEDNQTTGCKECSQNEKLFSPTKKLLSPKKKVLRNSGVEEIHAGHDADGDVSDDISVISESEIEHPNFYAPPETSDHQKDVMLKPNSSIVKANEPIGWLENLRKIFFLKYSTPLILVLSILVAILAGIFCQIGIIINNQQSQSAKDINLMLYEHKIKELEHEIQKLNSEKQLLNDEIFKLKQESEQIKTQRVKNSEKTKNKRNNFKTRFDKFERHPVATGGQEDTFKDSSYSNIDKDEYQDEPWQEPILEPLFDFIDDNVANDDTFFNKNDFIEINQLNDEENNKFLGEPEKAMNLDANSEIKSFEETDQLTENVANSFINKTKEGSSKEIDTASKSKGKKHKKKERYSENKEEYEKHNKQTQKYSKFENNHDKYEDKKQNKFEKTETQEYKQKPEKFRSKKEYNQDMTDKEISKVDEKFEKKNKKKNRKNYCEPGQDNRQCKEKSSSPENYKKKNWQDERMKNREKNRDNKENWYIDRKNSRENYRQSKEKDDNWYLERNLERELLRSRHFNSEEVSNQNMF